MPYFTRLKHNCPENKPEFDTSKTIIFGYTILKKNNQKEKKFNNNRLQYVFLPLVKDVETDMRSLLISEGAYVKVAQLLGKRNEDVFGALSGIAGLNHHDWWDELCTMLGVNTHVMLYALYDIWKEKNQNEIQAFINDLDSIVSEE